MASFKTEIKSEATYPFLLDSPLIISLMNTFNKYLLTAMHMPDAVLEASQQEWGVSKY